MTHWTYPELRRIAELGKTLASVEEIADQFPRHPYESVRRVLGEVCGFKTRARRRLQRAVRLQDRVFGR